MHTIVYYLYTNAKYPILFFIIVNTWMWQDNIIKLHFVTLSTTQNHINRWKTCDTLTCFCIFFHMHHLSSFTLLSSIAPAISQYIYDSTSNPVHQEAFWNHLNPLCSLMKCFLQLLLFWLASISLNPIAYSSSGDLEFLLPDYAVESQLSYLLLFPLSLICLL